MRRRGYRLLLAASAIACAGALAAAETITYRYDPLGRLVRVERSGGPQGGVNNGYGYDCADNRTQVLTGAAPAPPPPCPPPPVPPPPPPPPPPGGG
jgi:hypothetical protein